VVLADGRVVRTDETHEPDLFWALRGGGGNFGVVTSQRVRLHPLADVSAGVVAFPWEQARSVFKAYDDMIATIPDELTLTPGFFPGPGGNPTVIMLHAWCGDRREDERVLDAVKGLGAPSMVQVGRTSPAQMLREADPLVLRGVSWIVRTVTLAKLEPAAVEALVDGMEHRSSPLSWIALLPFHGVGERIPLESTAFGLRARHFMLGIFAAWERGEDAPHRAWADTIEAKLLPHALPSAYPNYLGRTARSRPRRPMGRILRGSYGSKRTTTRTACSPRRPCRCWPRRGRPRSTPREPPRVEARDQGILQWSGGIHEPGPRIPRRVQRNCGRGVGAIARAHHGRRKS
jgi:hypothetical protein